MEKFPRNSNSSFHGHQKWVTIWLKNTVPKMNSWFMQFHNSQPTKRPSHSEWPSFGDCILAISKIKYKQCPEQSLENRKWTKRWLHTPPEQAIIDTSDHISTKISYQNYYSLCVTENTIHSKHHAIPMIILISRKLILSTQKAKFPEDRAFPELCSRFYAIPDASHIRLMSPPTYKLSIMYTNPPHSIEITNQLW